MAGDVEWSLHIETADGSAGDEDYRVFAPTALEAAAKALAETPGHVNTIIGTPKRVGS